MQRCDSVFYFTDWMSLKFIFSFLWIFSMSSMKNLAYLRSNKVISNWTVYFNYVNLLMINWINREKNWWSRVDLLRKRIPEVCILKINERINKINDVKYFFFFFLLISIFGMSLPLNRMYKYVANAIRTALCLIIVISVPLDFLHLFPFTAMCLSVILFLTLIPFFVLIPFCQKSM